MLVTMMQISQLELHRNHDFARCDIEITGLSCTLHSESVMYTDAPKSQFSCR